MTRRVFAAAATGAAVLLSGGCLPKARPPAPPRADIAAISDLHLGDPRSLVDEHDGRDVVVRRIAEAAAERGVHTLVLTGDVLELALASETSCFESARAFFTQLNRVRGLQRVVVVVGNHDHALFEEIPGPLPEKLGREFDADTRFHREVAAYADRLRITVVYPGWTVPVGAGAVHFTHGHYFDSVITPSFDPVASLQEIEERNQKWWWVLNAGGPSSDVRSAYRAAYHLGHHVAGFLDVVSGGARDEEPVEMTRREQERVSAYLDRQLGDPRVMAMVAGHTHSKGGRIAMIPTEDGRMVPVFDPGAFVIGHHGRRTKPHIFFLDSATGDMRLERISFPDEVVEEARERAFESTP